MGPIERVDIFKVISLSLDVPDSKTIISLNMVKKIMRLTLLCDLHIYASLTKATHFFLIN